MELHEVLILTTIEMLNFLLAYIVVFGAKLRREKGYIIVTYIAGLILQAVVFLFSGTGWDSMITMLYWFIIPVCWFTKRKKKWFALYPFVFLGMSIINVSATFAVAVITGLPEGRVVKNIQYRMLCEMFGIITLMIILIYQKIKKRKVIEVSLSWKQYILLFIGILCSIILIGTIQIVSSGEVMTVRIQNAAGTALVFTCVIFIILCLWQGIIMYQRMEYKNQMEKYEKFMQMQEEQIHSIVDRDEKMRRFRHDMNAHMTALRACVRERDYNKMSEYLDEIEGYSYIMKEIVYTGDSAVDAVYREMIENAWEKEIAVEYDINLNSGYAVKSFDLCVIVSNLLKNAIEANEKIEEADKRKIEVKMYAVDNYMQMTVENPVNRKVEIVDNVLRTSKRDKKYHGIGSENVRQTVEKYNGSVEYKCDDNKFSAEVFLQMK